MPELIDTPVTLADFTEITNPTSAMKLIALDGNEEVKVSISHVLALLLGTTTPAALDTLDELAAALGDDANFATTVTNALALKAALASPTFTGTPAAPTAAPGTNTTQLATTAFVKAADDLKANLSSPAFTGNPTAPTPTAGDNDTSIATTAFVKAAGDLKADLNSPVFTGNPTAPTAAVGDNDTSIATTAFVKAEIFPTIASGLAGAVGTLALAARTGTTQYNFGDTVAGSSLNAASAAGTPAATLSGTWRCLGFVAASATGAGATTLWMRIS